MFCKLAISSATMGLSAKFTVRAPKCRFDGKTEKKGEKQ